MAHTMPIGRPVPAQPGPVFGTGDPRFSQPGGGGIGMQPISTDPRFSQPGGGGIGGLMRPTGRSF